MAAQWGGRLQRVSEEEYWALTGISEAPFATTLGIDYQAGIVYYTADQQIGEIIHEMGHVFASDKPPNVSKEWTFFGWEWTVAKAAGCELEWIASSRNYSVPRGDEFGYITEGRQKRILRERYGHAKKIGLISQNGTPLCIRLNFRGSMSVLGGTMAKCEGLLEFEQIGGMLVRGPGGFHYRCSVCGASGKVKLSPTPGARCEKRSNRDVHTEHCCKKHGCKYNDKTCTVTTGKKIQSDPCEECGNEEEANRYQLNELKALVTEAASKIDGLLPKGIVRLGPVELSLTFEPNAGWSASFAYKISRRLNPNRFTTSDLSLSSEAAVEALLEKVELTAKNTGKRLGDLW
jgi:hypothetical protein